MGLEELSPNQVATQIFGSQSPSNATSITIVTRFPKHPATMEYTKALNKAGLITTTTTTTNSSSSSATTLSTKFLPMRDFCTMIRTEELVGMVRSTFTVWAALLGNPNGIARLYSIDSQLTRKASKGEKTIFRTYNWTHPTLQRRIHFVLYQVDG